MSWFSRLGIRSSPSSNNGDNDAWLMKIDLKREEPTRVNKDERIKKATEDQAPAAKYILQLDHNLLTPTEIEALKGIIRKLEDLLRSMCDYPSPPPSSPTKEI